MLLIVNSIILDPFHGAEIFSRGFFAYILLVLFAIASRYLDERERSYREDRLIRSPKYALVLASFLTIAFLSGLFLTAFCLNEEIGLSQTGLAFGIFSILITGILVACHFLLADQKVEVPYRTQPTYYDILQEDWDIGQNLELDFEAEDECLPTEVAQVVADLEKGNSMHPILSPVGVRFTRDKRKPERVITQDIRKPFG